MSLHQIMLVRPRPQMKLVFKEGLEHSHGSWTIHSITPLYISIILSWMCYIPTVIHKRLIIHACQTSFSYFCQINQLPFLYFGIMLLFSFVVNENIFKKGSKELNRSINASHVFSLSISLLSFLFCFYSCSQGYLQSFSKHQLTKDVVQTTTQSIG